MGPQHRLWYEGYGGALLGWQWRVGGPSVGGLVCRWRQPWWRRIIRVALFKVAVGVLALALAGSRQRHTMMPVILPPTPTMQQPPGTLLQHVEGVVVGGAMIGRSPPTRVDGNKTKAQRGKDKVEIVCCRHCKYCTQHGKGARSMSMCTGGQDGGLSLECILGNIITKCKCPSNAKDKGLNV